MAVKQKYYIRIRKELVEVTQDVYLEYYRAARREQAQKEKEMRQGVFSYDALDAEGRLGREMLSHSVDTEDFVASRIMCAKLHQSLELLPSSERDLLLAIYFDGLSERKLHEKTGIPQTTISYQKRKALARLKKLLEN